MNYVEWEVEQRAVLGGDPLWQVEAYRLALFLGDICWRDTARLLSERRTLGVAEQLYSAVGSIGANIAEGYGRGPGRDRARFYSYALGSAREVQTWYFSARHILGQEVHGHRYELTTSIIRLLTSMTADQRRKYIREETVLYQTTATCDVPFST